MFERLDDDFIPVGDAVLGEDGNTPTEAEPAEIRAEIRETRERLGDDLEQLGERLSPSHLKEQVKQDIRDATIGKVENMAQSAAEQMDEARQTVGRARRTVADAVRENPIPAAMVGIGLGLLIYNSREQGRTGRSSFTAREGRGGVGGYGRGYTGSAYGERMSAPEYGSEGPGDSGTMERARGRAAEMAGDVQETAGELADRAQNVAHNVADKTRYQARRIEDQFRETPLAIGAAALALGMAAGLAIPETRKESELMGDARDRLANKAREVTGETRSRVERVVGSVADEEQNTARAAANEQGLTTP